MKSLMLAIVFLVAAVAAPAQEVIVNGNAGLNADSPYNRLYNPRTVVTFKGKISGIQSAPPMNGVGNIVTYVVKAGNGGTTIVDVGPEWFVSNQKVAIKMGDPVQVTGSKVMVNGRGVILAEMIVKNKNVLTLRAPTGRPYWDAVTVEVPVTSDGRLFSGQVIAIGSMDDGNAGRLRTVTLQTEDGTVTIGLAPDWYMQRQDLRVALGDQIAVRTFMVEPTQPVATGLVAPPVVYATAFSRGNNWMVLRFQNGRPVWYPVDGG